MKFLHIAGNDPWFNLATDEYLLKEKRDDFFVLSINSPCVVIGKHQVAAEEANLEYVTHHNIPVIRRISGGGTVYHDHGNINFSVIRSSASGKQINFELYTRPVLEYLISLGIDASFGGKNDLRYRGLKISGNAEHIYKERVLHHGTLLFDTDMEMLRRSIKPGKAQYTSRSVKSNRTDVVNLSELLPPQYGITEFLSGFRSFLMEKEYCDKEYNLTDSDRERVLKLVDEKYKTWEWNRGWGPQYEAKVEFILSGERYMALFVVKSGYIVEANVSEGTYSSLLKEYLIGQRHDYKEFADGIGALFKGEADNIVASFF